MLTNGRDLLALFFLLFVVFLPFTDSLNNNNDGAGNFALGAFVATVGLWLIYHVSFS